MKKIALMLIPFLMVLGACGNDDPAPVPTETTQSPDNDREETQSPEDEFDEEFVDIVREEIDTTGASDDDILDMADLICDTLEVATIEEVLDTLVESGFSEYDSGFLVGASVSGYCPDLEYLLDEYLDGLTGPDQAV